MRVCVDTAILIDILKDEYRSFQDKLYTALERREDLVAPSVVYAELMPQFKGNTKMLSQFLEEHKIIVEPLGVDSVVAAAQAWMRYLKRKKKEKFPQCGLKLNLKNISCLIFILEGLLLQSVMPFLPETEVYTPSIFPSWLGMKIVSKHRPAE